MKLEAAEGSETQSLNSLKKIKNQSIVLRFKRRFSSNLSRRLKKDTLVYKRIYKTDVEEAVDQIAPSKESPSSTA